jgi:hypothetical protein
MVPSDPTATDLSRFGTPFNRCPTIRIFAVPSVFAGNLRQSGLAGVANELAGDMSSAWENGVREALTALSAPHCWASRCVLNEIDWYGKHKNLFVFILPRDMDVEQAIWADRTDLTPQERVVKAWLNASSKGRQGATGPGAMSDASKNQPGRGDHAVVQFDPLVWNANNAFREISNQMFPGRYGPYGTSPEEALLHELVHAMRTIKGMTDLTTTHSPFYENYEEFTAVTVTNIHIGEHSPGGIRLGHTGFTPMPRNWSSSEGFLSDRNNRECVNYLIRQDRSFCNTLAQTVYVNSWNPIRLALRPLVTSAY